MLRIVKKSHPNSWKLYKQKQVPLTFRNIDSPIEYSLLLTLLNNFVGDVRGRVEVFVREELQDLFDHLILFLYDGLGLSEFLRSRFCRIIRELTREGVGF